MEKLQGITAPFANELNDTEQEPDEVERAMVPDADSARSPAMSDGTSLATPARAIRDGGKVASARAHVYDEIDAAVVKLGLSLLAKNYILGALKSPSRRPHGRVTGRYPSPGMGVSFGIEHGPLGVAALTELETDSKWKVRSILRGTRKSKKSGPTGKGGGGDSAPPTPVPAIPSNTGPKSPAGTPFERNPTRDVVGEEA